jgi:hypothetical protein
MGDANLTRASELVFPQLVLTLFTNDILLDQLAANGQSAKGVETPIASVTFQIEVHMMVGR